jgi:hypothetical protein
MVMLGQRTLSSSNGNWLTWLGCVQAFHACAQGTSKVMAGSPLYVASALSGAFLDAASPVHPRDVDATDSGKLLWLQERMQQGLTLLMMCPATHSLHLAHSASNCLCPDARYGTLYDVTLVPVPASLILP